MFLALLSLTLLSCSGIKKEPSLNEIKPIGPSTYYAEIENSRDGKKEVTIKTTKEGKTTVKTLKGKEAEDYLNKHKVHSNYFSRVDKNGKDVIILKGKMKKHFKSKGNDEKEIEVIVNNGVKEITVTITKNGKKSVKVYKGQEAEKFLENLDDNDEINVDINDKDNMTKIIIFKKEKKTDKK